MTSVLPPMPYNSYTIESVLESALCREVAHRVYKVLLDYPVLKGCPLLEVSLL